MGYETDHKRNGSAAISGTCEASCSALLTAYAETCRHIEELERIQAGSKHMVLTCDAKKRADSLIERILALMPNNHSPSD